MRMYQRWRPKTVSPDLETLVAKKRSVLSPAVDKKAVSLIFPAVEEYMANKIDEAELARRKAAARAKAEAEEPVLCELNTAFAKYTTAVAARVAAQESVAALMKAEDTAEAELRALLPNEKAGPSGLVKGEQS